jgi:hypothetical protein
MIHRFPVYAVLGKEVGTDKTITLGATPEAEVASEIASEAKSMFRAVLAVPGLSDDDTEKAMAAFRSINVVQGILVVNDEKGVVDADDVTVAA